MVLKEEITLKRMRSFTRALYKSRIVLPQGIGQGNVYS